MSYTTDFPSLRGAVSEAEWQARVELAACYRLVDLFGMTDLIYNHITARIPGTDDHLLINLYGLLYREITASSLVKIDIEGNVLGSPTPITASTSQAMSSTARSTARGARSPASSTPTPAPAWRCRRCSAACCH